VRAEDSEPLAAVTRIAQSLPGGPRLTIGLGRHCKDNIWILGTPISIVGQSISNDTFDIEDFDIECVFDIDVFIIRYRISISEVFDIE
jgi:hypothetical protein